MSHRIGSIAFAVVGVAVLTAMLSSDARGSQHELPYVSMNYRDAAPTDAAARAEVAPLYSSLEDLLTLENHYFERTGRYTADNRELGNYRGYPRAQVSVTAAPSLIVIHARGPAGNAWTIVSWRRTDVTTMTGEFGGPASS